MDIQRYLLIAAAAALSFMLLTEWSAFKEQRVVNTLDDRSRIADTFDDSVTSTQSTVSVAVMPLLSVTRQQTPTTFRLFCLP